MGRCPLRQRGTIQAGGASVGMGFGPAVPSQWLNQKFDGAPTKSSGRLYTGSSSASANAVNESMSMARVFLVMLLFIAGSGLLRATLQDPSTPNPPAHERVAVPEPSEKAVSYHRSGNILWLVGLLWSVIVPVAFLWTGFSGRIRDVAQRIGRRRFFVIGIYFVIFSVIGFVLDLPLTYYGGYVREHAYGLSNQTFGKWLGDAVKGLLVGICFGVAFLWLPFALVRRSPRRWWLYIGLLTIPFLLFVLLISPIWIDPLFNTFGPMKDKALEAKILELADRAGIQGSRVFEVAKSEDTKALNAYVTGFGDTKRIVLWDTAIAALDERELLVVMGHEMGHYVLGHVWRIVVFFSMLITAALYAMYRTADWVIRRNRSLFGFGDLSDVAALPLILLLFNTYLFLMSPVMMAFLRHHEHEADRFGLEVTRDNRAAAMAFVKLQQGNLAVPRPGWLYTTWRASHPALGERIDFSNDYRPWELNQPLVYKSLFRNGRR
jgi:STE24 endopeptidase